MKVRSAPSALPAVTVYLGTDEPERRASSQGRGAVSLRPADLLLPLALGSWAFALSHVVITRLGPYGLLPELPFLCYVSFGVFLISATSELTRARPSPWRMALHAVALVVMLYAIAPLVYHEGRYEWLYKTVGVVQYINVHGRLNPRIDIYQNWPGFFAFAAWFDKVAGVGSPLVYAKWVQVVFELAALPLLYLIYSAFSLSVRQRWTAILLYSASNWIGQDYFSPQGLSTVLSLGLMALATQWLYAEGSPARRPTGRRRSRRRRGPPMSLSGVVRSQRFRSKVAPVLAILVIYTFVTVTHELSPYMIAEQLGVLAAFRLLRPRWLPLVLAAIAVAYLIPHFSFVSSHYALLKSIGHFFTNLKPPSFSAPNVSPQEKLIQESAEALSIGMWLLAGLGAWLNRRAGKAALGLLLLAYSPVVVLALGSYGSEGILRVYLFSLTWSAALAAMVLAPSRRLAVVARPSRVALIARALRRAARHVADGLRVPAYWRRPGVLRIPVMLGGAVALFFPAFFGDDGFNYMTKAEVGATTSFWQHARPGHVFLPVNAAPISDTSRYNLFSWAPIFGSNLHQSAVPVTYAIAEQLIQKAEASSHPHSPAYVMLTPNMAPYSNAYGITNPGDFYVLLDSLQRSPSWKLIMDRGGVIVYEFLPQR